MIIRSPNVRPGEFAIGDAKRLLQQYPLNSGHSSGNDNASFVPSPEVSRFIDHFVGAFFPQQASRLYEQKASAVLVIA